METKATDPVPESPVRNARVRDLDLVLYLISFSVGAVIAYAAWHEMPAHAFLPRGVGLALSCLCFAVSVVFCRKLLAPRSVADQRGQAMR